MSSPRFGSAPWLASDPTQAAARRRRFSTRLALDYAQVPAVWSQDGGHSTGTHCISSVEFDHVGEFLAASSTNGSVSIQVTHQYASAAVAAAAAASRLDFNGEWMTPRHADVVQPIHTIATGRRPSAVRWCARQRNQLLCGFVGAVDLRVYDLGASDAHVRELRSDARPGFLDVVFAADDHLVVAGGRDGELRAWDLRARGSVVRQSTLTRGWTMGKRVRAGAVNSLAANRDGQQIHAATDGGCVLTWDVRKLNSVYSAVQVSTEGMCAEVVRAHPRLRSVVVTQLLDGGVSVVDVERQRVMASTRTDDEPQLAMQQSSGSGSALAGSAQDGSDDGGFLDSIAGDGGAGHGFVGGAGAALLGHGQGAFAGGTFSGGGGTSVVAGRGLRGRRLDWLCDEFICCATVGEPKLRVLRLFPHCSTLSPPVVLATSAPVVCLDANPRCHFMALGMADNAIGMLHPLPLRRRQEEREREELERALEESDREEAMAAAKAAAEAEAEAAAQTESALSKCLMELAAREAATRAETTPAGVAAAAACPEAVGPSELRRASGAAASASGAQPALKQDAVAGTSAAGAAAGCREATAGTHVAAEVQEQTVSSCDFRSTSKAPATVAAAAEQAAAAPQRSEALVGGRAAAELFGVARSGGIVHARTAAACAAMARASAAVRQAADAPPPSATEAQDLARAPLSLAPRADTAADTPTAASERRAQQPPHCRAGDGAPQPPQRSQQNPADSSNLTPSSTAGAEGLQAAAVAQPADGARQPGYAASGSVPDARPVHAPRRGSGLSGSFLGRILAEPAVVGRRPGPPQSAGVKAPRRTAAAGRAPLQPRGVHERTARPGGRTERHSGGDADLIVSAKRRMTQVSITNFFG